MEQVVLESIKQLLQQFQPVFEDPKMLLPAREVDHKIPLEEGSKQVSIRPYRYPHFKKTNGKISGRIVSNRGHKGE